MLLTDPGTPKVASERNHHDGFVGLTTTPYHARVRRRDILSERASSPLSPSLTSRKTNRKKSLTSTRTDNLVSAAEPRSARRKTPRPSSAKSRRSTAGALFDRLSSSFSSFTINLDMDHSNSSAREETILEISQTIDDTAHVATTDTNSLDGSISVVGESSLNDFGGFSSLNASERSRQDDYVGLTPTPYDAKVRRREIAGNASSPITPSPRPRSSTWDDPARKKTTNSSPSSKLHERFSSSLSGLTVPLDMDNSNSNSSLSCKDDAKREIRQAPTPPRLPRPSKIKVQNNASMTMARYESPTKQHQNPSIKPALPKIDSGRSTQYDDVVGLTCTPYHSRARRRQIPFSPRSKSNPKPSQSSTTDDLSPLRSTPVRKKTYFSAKSVRATTSSLFERLSSSLSDFSISLDMDMGFSHSTEEAKREIRQELASIEERLLDTKMKMQNDGTCAIARFESSFNNVHGPAGNPRGALISMKKLKQSQKEYKDLELAREKLHQLLSGIESHEIKPSGYRARIKEILGTCSEKVEYTDNDLLDELLRGDVEKQIEDGAGLLSI